MIAPEIALATLTNNLIYCLTGGLRITYEYSKKSKLAIDNTVYFIFLLVNVSYLTISPSNNLFINFLYVGIISFLYLIIPILKIRLYSYALERVPKSNTDPEQEKWKEYEFFLKRGLIKEEKGFCNKNIINNWFHGLIISLLTAFILNENIYNEFLFKYFLLTTVNIVLLSISNPRMDNLMSDVYLRGKYIYRPYTAGRYYIFFVSALAFLRKKNYFIYGTKYRFTYFNSSILMYDKQMIKTLEILVPFISLLLHFELLPKNYSILDFILKKTSSILNVFKGFSQKKILHKILSLSIFMLWSVIDNYLKKFIKLSIMSWAFLYLYRTLISIFNHKMCNSIFMGIVFLTLYYYSFDVIYANVLPYIIKIGIISGKYKTKIRNDEEKKKIVFNLIKGILITIVAPILFILTTGVSILYSYYKEDMITLKTFMYWLCVTIVSFQFSVIGRKAPGEVIQQLFYRGLINQKFGLSDKDVARTLSNFTHLKDTIQNTIIIPVIMIFVILEELTIFTDAPLELMTQYRYLFSMILAILTYMSNPFSISQTLLVIGLTHDFDIKKIYSTKMIRAYGCYFTLVYIGMIRRMLDNFNCNVRKPHNIFPSMEFIFSTKFLFFNYYIIYMLLSPFLKIKFYIYSSFNIFLAAQGSFPFRMKNKSEKALNVKEDCCTKNIEKVIRDILQKQFFSLKKGINVNDRLIVMHKNNTSFVKFAHISYKKVTFSTVTIEDETVNKQLIKNLFENKIQGSLKEKLIQPIIDMFFCGNNDYECVSHHKGYGAGSLMEVDKEVVSKNLTIDYIREILKSILKILNENSNFMVMHCQDDVIIEILIPYINQYLEPWVILQNLYDQTQNQNLDYISYPEYNFLEPIQHFLFYSVIKTLKNKNFDMKNDIENYLIHHNCMLRFIGLKDLNDRLIYYYIKQPYLVLKVNKDILNSTWMTLNSQEKVDTLDSLDTELIPKCLVYYLVGRLQYYIAMANVIEMPKEITLTINKQFNAYITDYLLKKKHFLQKFFTVKRKKNDSKR